MRPKTVPVSALSLSLALACGRSDADATSATTSAGESTTTITSGDSTDASTTTPTTTDAASSDTTDPGASSTTDPAISSSGSTIGSTTDSTTGDTTGSTTASTTGDTTDSTTAGTTGDTGGESQLCPAAIDAAILACIADLQADPELADGVFLIDLLFMCSDAEPVADDYDAHCAAQPDDPICALTYEAFVADVLPECIARAQEVVFAEVCLLPATYQELLFTPAIALMQRRFVVSADQLDAAEQAQVLAASADIGFPVDTVEAALLATDDDGMEQLTVLDVGTDRTLVSFSGHYGDTRVGRVFLRGTLTVVGAIEDSEFTRCGVERTIEGQPCVDDVACTPDHICLDILTDADDVVLAPGTCVSLAPLPGEGEPCASHVDCEPASGLLCLDSLGAGTCRPGWMRRSFAGPDGALVPGGVLDLPIAVSGLATVPTAAYLDLQLTQDGPNALDIRLVNPLGTATLVSATDEQLIALELAVMPVPGDESAGGTWHLRVEDIGGQASGSVDRLALTLDTRWD